MIFINPAGYTRFEVARIIGTRALQIFMGAPILLKGAEKLNSPIKIAEKEFKEGVIPLTVKRPMPLKKGESKT